jgi:hypothetical protein
MWGLMVSYSKVPSWPENAVRALGVLRSFPPSGATSLVAPILALCWLGVTRHCPTD